MQFITALVSFIITAVLGILLIPVLDKLKFGQRVRDDGPQSHLKKMGTPTMGGIIFIPAIALATLLFSDINVDTVALIFIITGFGLIGFADDFIKISKKRSLGLRANQKLLFQLLLSAGLMIYIFAYYAKPTEIIIPLHHLRLDLGLFYIPFTVFLILGTVNSVNLTDGLDGLVSGIIAIIAFFYTALLAQSNLNLAIFSSAVTGGCLGFLLFNRHPARVFMGDTGSLGLGGALAAITVLSRSHLFLAIIGIIFIIETLSVILQVLSFKFTGKRILKMSPIHHHFELCGWSERKVVHTFWLITLIAGILALMMFM
ncbi:MAG: phospho-N-acetylmuramoyl-pentapeptide-transferase [Tepidanaerobacteraceae bacterium]|nr:phospho-N-acetylmuramoyl-pentapeptide-transferase [Tepidanaerobacteraceae bacterium]HQE05855.1 phospho-N-acetylmuramoyl-pentapeptide-transferase [Tepidanaerobacteraceae bacterium]